MMKHCYMCNDKKYIILLIIKCVSNDEKLYCPSFYVQ